ncbi:hypothetical protein RclHR1_04920001 [Rhizophagus clarus]|uniref:Protein kinase domain-containing protein n=1 Tax=Rhizophagus clarus TaxID=94130 RepID=A0A2Z6S2T9_9GLOM|nr:hypothetical protein RclHR1_04920001 [Rhizophagus clarus]
MSNNIEHKNSINSNEWNKWIQEANSSNHFVFYEYKYFIKEIVHELKLQHQIGFHNNIIRFYGITDKIMHSNNVLIHQNAIKLADLGLSKRIQESNIQSKLYEMVAYVDPKMFNHVQTYSLNKKSDIYSIGVLFWEISSGRPPFCNEPCDGGNLATKILHGLREAPIPGTLECCINIHTDCWNSEPDNRPAINQVVGRLKTLNTSNNKCNSNVDIQLSSEQQLNLKSNVFEVSKDIIYSSHCSHENLSQFIRNFDKINIKEIEPLTSIIPINIIVDEILYILNKLEKVDERREILNYLNNYNMTPQEIYYCRKAFELYQKAANLGNNIAQFNLAFMYDKGEYVDKDDDKAFELFKKSAEGEYPGGISELGYCYYNGIGTDVDKQKAFELYRKAANLRSSTAQYNLAFMYENEEIVKNINQAIYWYNKSAEQGFNLLLNK